MENAIGLFDSGLGGLTVMKELIRLLPQENFIYLGDTANLPYGDKPKETIIQYARQNAQNLLGMGIKLLVIPCHTVCSHALHILEQALPIPVVGVIEPGLTLIRPFQKVAVLGTTSTIESGFYQRAILEQNPKAILFPKACPLFVPLIEEGRFDEEETYSIAKKTLEELLGKIDAALLACTHYPFMQKIIQKALGADVALLDPAELCARRVLALLEKTNSLKKSRTPPKHQFYVTANPEKFQRLGEMFLLKQMRKTDILKSDLRGEK